MILLDTDHLTVLRYPESNRHGSLQARLQQATDKDIGMTIVNVEEQMRGWLALIHRLRDVHSQISAYDRLEKLLRFLGEWQVASWNAHAADEFQGLRKAKV